MKTLDKVVLDALELHSSYKLPAMDFGKRKRRLVIASGNALPTGKILFQDEDAVFASEDQYEAVIKKVPIDGAVVISASGEKHAPIILKRLMQLDIAPLLITCTEGSSAAKLLSREQVFVTRQNPEPITYNTSTYLGMILAKTKEDPKRIATFIKKFVDPDVPDMSKFEAFYLMVGQNFSIICEMFVTKFDELFGPQVNGRCYTVNQTLHAKTVVGSERELFISFGYVNNVFGSENSRLNIPLNENAGYAAAIAIGYYVIGKIQTQFPPYFMECAEEYKELQPKLFKKVLGSNA